MVIPLVFGLWSAILSPQNKMEVNKMPQWTRVIAVQASWLGKSLETQMVEIMNPLP